jgi:hypothetical protein
MDQLHQCRRLAVIAICAQLNDAIPASKSEHNIQKRRLTVSLGSRLRIALKGRRRNQIPVYVEWEVLAAFKPEIGVISIANSQNHVLQDGHLAKGMTNHVSKKLVARAQIQWSCVETPVS